MRNSNLLRYRCPVGQLESEQVKKGYRAEAAESMSLHASAYTEQQWFDVDLRAIVARSWQWWCHREELREPGAYVSGQVANMPIVVVRGQENELRGFYNVCQHRAHELVPANGCARSTGRAAGGSKLVCPYHAWSYDLTGQLIAARHTGDLINFTLDSVHLKSVRVEEFAGFVFVNLDESAAPLAHVSGELSSEINYWAPDIAHLTHAKRLTYDIASNWKNVIDNFLECYHCHVAHKDFVSLVDMSTYKVTTHGMYSSHMAKAGTSTNSAYNVQDASVTDHAVWWLWPNTCLLRYPGRGNMMVLQVIPIGRNRTLETYDIYLETAEPNDAEVEAITYLDQVLQIEDIALVESVQRGMQTPAFDQGRIVVDKTGSGLSEHALHHFHGLVLDAYRKEATRA